MYTDPRKTHALEVDQRTGEVYLGCDYGLIKSDLATGAHEVLSVFDGLVDCHVRALELDEGSNRLFVLVGTSNDVHVVDLATFSIVQRYRLHAPTTLVNAAEFEEILYHGEQDMLFLGSDAGLAALNLTNGSFEFYDFIYFDVPFARYEVIGDTVQASTNESFSINGLSIDIASGKLYIATNLGLSIYDTRSANFSNFRIESPLAGEVMDVVYAEEKKKVFLALGCLTMYDPVSGTVEVYPDVVYENHSHKVCSLLYDSDRDLVYAGVYGIEPCGVVFAADSLAIERTFYPVDRKADRHAFHQSIRVMRYLEEDGEVLVGVGDIVHSGSTWEIQYTRSKETTVVVGKRFESIVSQTEEQLIVDRSLLRHSSCTALTYGTPMFAYDFDGDSYRQINLTKSKALDYSFLRIQDFKVHPGTGIAYLVLDDYTMMVDKGCEVRRVWEYERGRNIRGVEFLNDSVYMTTGSNVWLMNLTTEDIDYRIHPNLTGSFAKITRGTMTGRLFISKENQIVVYDPIANETTSYDVNRTMVYLVVDRDESTVHIGDYYGLYHLHLSNGTLEVQFEPDYLYHYSDILYHRGTDSLILNDLNGLVAFNESVLEGFPETGSIADICLDQNSEILYAVNGVWSGGSGTARNWRSDQPDGLIIYDIEEGTYTNYTMAHGLPFTDIAGIAVDPVRGQLHIVGVNFYSIINISDLDMNATGLTPPVTVFLPVEPSEQVVGFSGEEETIWIYLFIAGVSLSTVGGATAFTIEPSKCKLLTLLAAPLYTRLKKGDVLEHETRGRIIGHIEKDPGINYSKLRKDLGLNHGTLSYHLQVLEREGYVRSMNVGKFKHFFSGDIALPRRFFRMNDVQKVIFRTVLENPGISQKEISRDIGASSSTVNYNVGILADKGIIKVIKEGNTTHCSVIDDKSD